MNRLIVLTFVFAFLMPASADEPPADSDTHEKVVQDMLQALQSATKLFAGVIDAETAMKAKPNLDKLALEMRVISERISKLGTPTKEQEAELDKKFKSQVEEITKAYSTQYLRLIKEPFGKEIATILERKPGAK